MRDTERLTEEIAYDRKLILAVMLPLGAWLTTSLFYKQKTAKSLTTIALFSAKVNFEKILHPETLTDTQLGATITVAMT